MSSDWITPNEGWADKDAPVGRDMRRIESNTDYLHRTLLGEAAVRLDADNNETSARIQAIAAEALARIQAIATEEQARSIADSALSSDVNSRLASGALINIENRSSDPASPAVGHMWIRVDL